MVGTLERGRLARLRPERLARAYNRTVRRTDLQDTSEWAHREMVRLLRGKTPSERLEMVFDRVDTGREIDRLAKLRLSEREDSWVSKKQ